MSETQELPRAINILFVSAVGVGSFELDLYLSRQHQATTKALRERGDDGFMVRNHHVTWFDTTQAQRQAVSKDVDVCCFVYHTADHASFFHLLRCIASFDTYATRRAACFVVGITDAKPTRVTSEKLDALTNSLKRRFGAVHFARHRTISLPVPESAAPDQLYAELILAGSKPIRPLVWKRSDSHLVFNILFVDAVGSEYSRVLKAQITNLPSMNMHQFVSSDGKKTTWIYHCMDWTDAATNNRTARQFADIDACCVVLHTSNRKSFETLFNPLGVFNRNATRKASFFVVCIDDSAPRAIQQTEVSDVVARLRASFRSVRSMQIVPIAIPTRDERRGLFFFVDQLMAAASRSPEPLCANILLIGDKGVGKSRLMNSIKRIYQEETLGVGFTTTIILLPDDKIKRVSAVDLDDCSESDKRALCTDVDLCVLVHSLEHPTSLSKLAYYQDEFFQRSSSVPPLLVVGTSTTGLDLNLHANDAARAVLKTIIRKGQKSHGVFSVSLREAYSAATSSKTTTFIADTLRCDVACVTDVSLDQTAPSDPTPEPFDPLQTPVVSLLSAGFLRFLVL